MDPQAITRTHSQILSDFVLSIHFGTPTTEALPLQPSIRGSASTCSHKALSPMFPDLSVLVGIFLIMQPILQACKNRPGRKEREIWIGYGFANFGALPCASGKRSFAYALWPGCQYQKRFKALPRFYSISRVLPSPWKLTRYFLDVVQPLIQDDKRDQYK
ncbi:hypothetical protein BDM02DRAFT_2051593 [Thelephora ganbajun]|uniref:Uncharacterized protein n=1 Tax=Thelephora ganbajun TaxID=370292 RepID=A0ACB6ZHH1_THEGA|nr:hypothetical protein BDM02DRAFT_2051593 [Thelephora ganbajun]